MSYPPPPMNPVQPGTPAPKKSSAGGIIIGVVVGVLVLCMAAGGVAFFAFNRLADKAGQSLQDLEDTLASAAADPGPKKTATGNKHTVRYEIDGSGDNIMVNWALGGGGQDNDITSLPWSKELTFEREAAGLQVFAIVTGTGNVDGCRILVDGKELVKGESEQNGKYTICTVVFQE